MSAATSSRTDSGETAIAAALEVIGEARSAGYQTRVLGGIGVALRCPSARGDQPFTRAYSDMDLVTTRQAGPGVSSALTSLGYQPAERFNLLHGRTRMMFDRSDGTHVDVFIDEFAMCHRLDLSERLGLHDTTIALSDLLLTKMQVADLNEKDVTDAAALLLDHQFGRGPDRIDTAFIADLLGSDWGWWRTVTHNLAALKSHLAAVPVSPPAAEVIEDRASELLDQIDKAPKSLRWRVRAIAGDKVAWREDPEESH